MTAAEIADGDDIVGIDCRNGALCAVAENACAYRCVYVKDAIGRVGRGKIAGAPAVRGFQSTSSGGSSRSQYFGCPKGNTCYIERGRSSLGNRTRSSRIRSCENVMRSRHELRPPLAARWASRFPPREIKSQSSHPGVELRSRGKSVD